MPGRLHPGVAEPDLGMDVVHRISVDRNRQGLQPLHESAPGGDVDVHRHLLHGEVVEVDEHDRCDRGYRPAACSGEQPGGAFCLEP